MLSGYIAVVSAGVGTVVGTKSGALVAELDESTRVITFAAGTVEVVGIGMEGMGVSGGGLGTGAVQVGNNVEVINVLLVGRGLDVVGHIIPFVLSALA
jgi:hypothetical protein